MKRLLLLALFVCALTGVSRAQVPAAGLDAATVARIKAEATERSQAMDHVWWLSEVHGPRATGTPAFEQASEWAMKRFTEWGLKNVHQERFPFGQGWTIERFSVHLVEPQTQAFVGQPRWNSPSTAGPILSDVVHVRATSEAELAKYKGQLRGKIVVMQPVRPVRLLDGRVVLRMGDGEWAEAMTMPEPAAARPPDPARQEQVRAAQAFAAAMQQFLVAEGVAALLERGSDADASAGGSDLSWQTQRTDGGTIFPSNGGSRDPNGATQVPSATLSVEHYNRIVRLLERSVPVRMEVNIQTRFHAEAHAEGNAINTIAEIPGTDLAHEVVLLGAHVDSYPYAGGATDNATGSAAMMEAVRVIQALGLRPRRTIRIALWAAEEQGLLGSRAYVQKHLFEAGAAKPDHANLAAYFNLDNGTGRIRGIWSQGNLGALQMFDRWGAALKDVGWTAASPRSVASTDHSSFDNVGLPGFQFIQERLEYNSRTHHSNMDTFDHVQRDDLTQQGVVAAVFAWHAANWPEKLPRKPATARGTGQ